MPTSLPAASTSAPPEMPGLIAAEVWMAEVTTGPGDGGSFLKGSVSPGGDRAVGGNWTIPVVTVLAKPERVADGHGRVADGHCGGSRRWRWEPGRWGFFRVSTARSVDGSVPAIVASYATVGQGDRDRPAGPSGGGRRGCY